MAAKRDHPGTMIRRSVVSLAVLSEESALIAHFDMYGVVDTGSFFQGTTNGLT